MTIYAVKKPDNTIVILTLISGTIEEEIQKLDFTPVKYFPVLLSDIPSDRNYRDAMEEGVTPDTLEINITKAKTIHMDKIRLARNERLAEKDIEYMKALESGDTVLQASLTQEKQTLRDIPQVFDLSSATDTASLKDLWPSQILDLKDKYIY